MTVKDLIPMSAPDNSYELLLPVHKELDLNTIKDFNIDGYIYTDELLEVEFDDEGGPVTYKNIYYFKKA